MLAWQWESGKRAAAEALHASTAVGILEHTFLLVKRRLVVFDAR
jgi:hypothetical protein